MYQDYGHPPSRLVWSTDDLLTYDITVVEHIFIRASTVCTFSTGLKRWDLFILQHLHSTYCFRRLRQIQIIQVPKFAPAEMGLPTYDKF